MQNSCVLLRTRRYLRRPKKYAEMVANRRNKINWATLILHSVSFSGSVSADEGSSPQKLAHIDMIRDFTGVSNWILPEFLIGFWGTN